MPCCAEVATRRNAGASPGLSRNCDRGATPQGSGHGPSGREGRGEVDPAARKPAYPRFESEDARTLVAARMITLVLGGARSGKSEMAEGVAATFPLPVTYVATECPDLGTGS